MIYPTFFRLAKSKDFTVAEVVCLFGNGSASWNKYFTRPLLGREEGLCKGLAERVSGTMLNLNIEDRLCWEKDKDGDFSAKKCTELLMLDDGENNTFYRGKLWKIKVPPRVNCFLWMLVIDILPTKEFLVKRGASFQNLTINCPWCDGVPECDSYLFFKCNFIESF